METLFKRTVFRSVIGSLLLFFLTPVVWGQVPDRRKDQFPSEFSYLIFPAPYSLPGIGSGLLMLGVIGNALDTPTDFYGYKLFGEVSGTGLGVMEMPLGTNHLLLQLGKEDISRAQVNQYTTRGMQTHKEDYNLLDASDIHSRYGTLSLNLFDRRVEFLYDWSKFRARADAIRDYKGNLIRNIDARMENKGSSASLVLDLTDDNYDPIKGVRLMFRRGLPESRKNTYNPEFHVDEWVLNGYIPMGAHNTLALDFFRSAAVVTATGELDPNVIGAVNGCPNGVPDCQPLINQALLNNKYGTARSLGGRDRLRAYPDGRFQGAQAEYIGIEFRWNYSQEVTPFNYWIWKDTRTGLQMAFIAEAGTVAETPDQLWKESRKDAGVGFRMVTSSGAVYRADLLWGDEGFAPTIIVNYPW
ncbi:MAG: hypothetical protein OEW39_03815 [Deltaproteobacteria bacterium]|nr:hypothetical protein [Deltaproteobacteria bacterium]